MHDLSDIKVSVILPVYNSASFLKHCLDSILSQTLKEIEIICIDDASDDESAAILEDYSRKDDRLCVIRIEHSGAGAARNHGLDVARGEYVSILDADDFFEHNMIEKAYEEAQKTSSDIVIFRVDEYDHETRE